jgi:hypothetical protein
MKRTSSCDSTRNKKTAVSAFQKTWIALLALALMLASLPTPDVFAASTGDEEDSQLEVVWRHKIEMVQAQNLFYEQVRLYPADFRKTSDLDQAWETLHRYGAWLRRANTIIANHEGFDWAGNVINEEQAETTVRELAECLRAMRGLMGKLDGQAPKVHRVRHATMQ